MVTVKLFGTLRLDCGVRELQLGAGNLRELYPELCRALQARRPDLELTEMDLRWCLVAVNGVRVGPRTRLRDGDVVSFFPAAAGG